MGLDEYVDKCRDKWHTVANYKVDHLKLSDTFRIILPVESEPDIQGHCKSPARISRHKPMSKVRDGVEGVWRTYI
jgi:hypothetical protein